MSELKITNEESAALDRIEAELAGSQAGTLAVKAADFDLGDLCKKYQSIRSSLLLLIKIVKRIPVVGAKVAAALEFLMSLADIACPV